MQCPHCHYELPQGAPLKFCPYCAKPLQTSLLNRRGLPKWKQTSRICGGVSMLIGVLWFLCLFMPFIDLGLLGSLSGYEFISEVVNSDDSQYMGMIVSFCGLFIPLSFAVVGARWLFSERYGASGNEFLFGGIFGVIASVIIYSLVYKEMDGYTSAIGPGSYCILLLGLCGLGIGIYSRVIYSQLIYYAPPQPESIYSSTTGKANLYDVVLMYMPSNGLMSKSLIELSILLDYPDIGVLSEAIKSPPVLLAEAVSQADAQLICEKFEEVGAAIELRPHSVP